MMYGDPSEPGADPRVRDEPTKPPASSMEQFKIDLRNLGWREHIIDIV